MAALAEGCEHRSTLDPQPSTVSCPRILPLGVSLNWAKFFYEHRFDD
jgi:hypothetical protein